MAIQLRIPKPSEKQRIFLEDRHSYVAYGGARGGGKSWSVRVKSVLLCITHPGIIIMIIRRTYPELRANHIEPLRKMLGRKFARYNDSKGICLAVRINATNHRNKISLVNKVRSVGTRTHNLDKLLSENDILYLGKNKKETVNWFNALGRSTPFGGTKFGLIRSIRDSGENSNRAALGETQKSSTLSETDRMKYSIDPGFETRYDEWVLNGRPERTIRVGTTSDVIVKLGAKKQNVMMHSADIKHALRHDGITDNII